MSRGLHLLGYDQKKMASAVLSSLAEGFAQGATKQRAARPGSSPAPANPHASPPPPPPEKLSTVWYVAGAAALIVGALLWRSR